MTKQSHEPKMRTDRRGQLAQIGEAVAARCYRDQGGEIIARNWRAGRYAEIDLIVADQSGLIIFVEVKTRLNNQNPEYCSQAGFEAITRHKQHKIITAAGIFLARHGLTDSPVRLDAMLVELKGPIEALADRQLPNATITHVAGAFF